MYLLIIVCVTIALGRRSSHTVGHPVRHHQSQGYMSVIGRNQLFMMEKALEKKFEVG